MSLRIRRGTEAQRYAPGAPPTGIVFDPGELAWCLDTKKLYIGDGVTPGGVNVLQYMAGVGVSFNANTQALDFSQGNLTLTTANIAEDASRKYFTDIRAKDAVGAMLQAGSNTGISFSYNSSTHSITVNATGSQVPTPTLPGDIGKYLTLDNSGNPIWHNPPIPGGLSIPSFGGNAGKYLTTDAINLVWADISLNSLVNGAFHVDLDSGGNLKTSGSIKLPSTADITRETGIGTGVYTSVLGGLGTVSADTSPSLGGNLAAGSHNISNVGTLSASTVSASTISASTISASTISASTISASTGLGEDLSLNGHNINGTGNITTNGNITATNIGNGSLTINNNTINTGTYSCNVTSSNPATFNVVGLTDGSISGSVAIDINSSRGTIASPTTVQAGDYVSRITMAGWTGSGYTPAGSIYANFQAGAVLADVTPASQLTFVVGANGTNVQTAIFNSKGVFYAPILQPGSYYGTGAYPFAPPGLGGAILFDSSTKKFMGWDGTTWNVLG
jgi:hypothetical protein